jgi:hypothetical protein
MASMAGTSSGDYATARAEAGALLRANPIRSESAFVDPSGLRAFRRAAAVFVAIRNPEQLRPYGPVSSAANARELLGRELVRANVRAFDGRWMLTTSARRMALTELESDKDLQAALEANPAERTGPGQVLYERLLLKETVSLEGLGVGELEQMLQMLLWLQGVRQVDDLLRQTRERLEYARFLRPFEALAGDGVFLGRTTEMDDLRRHVGVVPPQQLITRFRDFVASAFVQDTQPALTVFGPGGIGKSALIARFALEHLRLPEPSRLPVAYLDFDRPDRDIADPLALVVEMVRQVRLQRPGQGRFDALWDFCIRITTPAAPADGDLVPSAARVELETMSTSSPRSTVARAISLLADLLGLLRGSNAPQPFVLILDSFEEVQYRDEARAFPLWEVLQSMGGGGAHFRIVISGRAPARSLRLNNQLPKELPIGELDAPAARSFLLSKGISEPEKSDAIFRLVGGSPLSLLLASTLLTRADDGETPLKDIPSRRRLWRSATDEVIQGQLYDRILGHIHSPRVRALAHPGLVLRRITPEVILQVLDRPCELAVADQGDALALFDELRRETSLVTMDDAEGALVHRSDLRRMMLRLIVAKEPAKVAEIHESAAAYYRKGEGQRAKAEYAYHRLHLGVRPTQRWFADPEVRGSIQASIADFPDAVQKRLLRLGFEVDPAVVGAAATDDKELAFIARVERRIALGLNAVQISYDEFSGHLSDAEPSLRMCTLGARLSAELRDAGLRTFWLKLAEPQALLSGDLEAALEFLSEQCWDRRGASAEGTDVGENKYLVQLQAYAGRLELEWAMAQSALHQLGAARGPNDLRMRRAEAAGSVVRLNADDLWAIFPALAEHIGALGTKGDDALNGQQFWQHLAALIADAEGPFARAQFDDSLSQMRLVQLVGLAREGAHQDMAPDEFERHMVAQIEELGKAWPYSILRVQPPYSSLSRSLREAA